MVSDANHILLPVLQHPPGFAGLHEDEGLLTPGSTGSHQTPAHESPEARELQGQACGVGGEERQQTTR